MLAFLKICRWMALQKIEHNNLLFGISFKMLVQHGGICEDESFAPVFSGFKVCRRRML